MAKLQSLSLATIKPNPHRRMETYPLNRRKLDALKQSIDQVGFWEGVIVRPAGDEYECAFGHHRLAAAREQLGESHKVSVIVRTDLDDAKMLQFMGRENGEDYNADFLVMLETWDAGVRFLREPPRTFDNPLKVAGFLGWTVLDQRDASIAMNETAKACNAAYKLREGGHLSNDDLRGLSVFQAREICQSTVTHLETIDRKAKAQAKVARHTGEPAPTHEQVTAVKREYASAAKTVAQDLRTGAIGTGKARGEIWSRADIRVREKHLPDFGIAIKQFRRQVQSWCNEDARDKAKELIAAAPYVQDTDDRAEYRYAARDLRDVMERCERIADGFEKAANPANVAHLQAVENQA